MFGFEKMPRYFARRAIGTALFAVLFGVLATASWAERSHVSVIERDAYENIPPLQKADKDARGKRFAFLILDTSCTTPFPKQLAQLGDLLGAETGRCSRQVFAESTPHGVDSFRIAVSFGAQLGGDWHRSGNLQIASTDDHGRATGVLLHHMERAGFVWLGKLHHFYKTPLEYRPEVIQHGPSDGEAAI